MKKVVICQHRLPHYRVGLFERLREACARLEIGLHLVHGQASERELVRNDEGWLPWAYKVTNRYWRAGACDVIWQPFPDALRDADLVILQQENRILSNYPLINYQQLLQVLMGASFRMVSNRNPSPSTSRDMCRGYVIHAADREI